MNKISKIFVTGHRGLVGSALVRLLKAEGYKNILTVSHSDLDLTDFDQVKWYFAGNRPEYVFMAAAKVGGIVGNAAQPVEFLLDNIRIQSNVIECAKNYGVSKLLFLGSACAYPKLAPNPIKEEYLLTGPLEPSNENYALAKIAGIKLCQACRQEYGRDFISAMPTNLYGIGDNYDLQTSHVIPGMIRRFHEAQESNTQVVLWGTGNPVREFLFSDDLARACWVLMNEYSGSSPVNVTSRIPITLRALADLVSDTTGYDHSGAVVWDSDKPDGTPARILDGVVLDELGWSAETSLPEGLKVAYQDFLCRQH